MANDQDSPKRPRTRRATHEEAIAYSARQSGIITRKQLHTLGFTDRVISNYLHTRRFSKLSPGVYNTVTGEPSMLAWWWAAHFVCGDRSFLFANSALHCWGYGQANLPVEIGMPHGNRRMPVDWITVTRLRNRPRIVFRHDLPVESAADALIDSTRHLASGKAVQNHILATMQKGITKPSDLKATIESRRVPHRSDFEQAVDDFGDGLTSALEVPGVKKIFRAHGLPEGVAQARIEFPNGPRVVDLLIAEYLLIIEFDGKLGHSDAIGRFRDLDRDNFAMASGFKSLRFGWHDVRQKPCEAAAQVIRVLRAAGWAGEATSCGKRCRLSSLK